MNTKKIIPFFLLVAFLILNGCAAYATSPVPGMLYNDVKAPLAVTNSQTAPTKKGVGEATSFLGLFAFGDTSIETIAQVAGITEIHHVDYHSTSILGLFATYEVTVYGN